MEPICPTTADCLPVQSQQNRWVESVQGFSSAVLIPFVLSVCCGNSSRSVSAGGKGWHMVILTRETTKCVTQALLKCVFPQQVLTWALTFIVAYSAVTLASNNWSSHKQTHSMGSELMSAAENQCWAPVQLTAPALLFSAIAPSPLIGSGLPHP